MHSSEIFFYERSGLKTRDIRVEVGGGEGGARGGKRVGSYIFSFDGIPRVKSDCGDNLRVI